MNASFKQIHAKEHSINTFANKVALEMERRKTLSESTDLIQGERA